MAGGIAAGVAIVAAVVIVVVVATGGGGSGEVIPPPVNSQPLTVEPPAVRAANPTQIEGVVAYVTTGWPTDSHNGPAKDALGHTHVTGPVQYSVTPPVGGDHNAEWMNCGVYTKPVPVERAVHNLEHGAIWITYRPDLPKAQVAELIAFQGRQTELQAPGTTGDSRYVDVTPFPGLPAPIVMSSWGFQLRLTSPTDPRMQQFVNAFRYNKTYTPEYQGPCVEGVGTPVQD